MSPSTKENQRCVWTNNSVIEFSGGNIIHVIVINLQLPNSDTNKTRPLI